MVGIMVENAVEEMTANDYDRKLLQFGIIHKNDNVFIVCTNTCKNPPPIEKIFTKDFSTKGANRGLGLYNLREMCNKCGNAWVSAHVEDEDTFTIAITVAMPTKGE